MPQTQNSYADTESWTPRTFSLPPDVPDAAVRLALAVGLFLDDHVTVGRGAEIAGVSYRAFVDALAERKIPHLAIAGGDYDEDLETFDERRTVNRR